MTMPTRSRLVIACVGDGSLHPKWLNNKDNRSFDLFLVYYGDTSDKWKQDADYYVTMKGAKYELLDRVAKQYGEVTAKYQTIWLPDDDILTDTNNINQMFDLFELHSLDVGQPALDHNSFVNVPLTRQIKYSTIRFNQCVEIMVPLFSQHAFNSCKSTFSETKAAWGIDWIWMKRIEADVTGSRKNGILDATPVTHTREQDLSKGFYTTLAVHPYEDMIEMLKRHDLDHVLHDLRSFLCYSIGISVFGKTLVIPMFPNVRFKLWQAYDFAKGKFR